MIRLVKPYMKVLRVIVRYRIWEITYNQHKAVAAMQYGEVFNFAGLYFKVEMFYEKLGGCVNIRHNQVHVINGHILIFRPAGSVRDDPAETVMVVLFKQPRQRISQV